MVDDPAQCLQDVRPDLAETELFPDMEHEPYVEAEEHVRLARIEDCDSRYAQVAMMFLMMRTCPEGQFVLGMRILMQDVFVFDNQMELDSRLFATFASVMLQLRNAREIISDPDHADQDQMDAMKEMMMPLGANRLVAWFIKQMKNPDNDPRREISCVDRRVRKCCQDKAREQNAIVLKFVIEKTSLSDETKATLLVAVNCINKGTGKKSYCLSIVKLAKALGCHWGTAKARWEAAKFELKLCAAYIEEVCNEWNECKYIE